ncbi:hypothetical protein [Micromonospora yangpuensis]|uniref:hypothetical protein n=1 Tax=Micromonospora yangpuensis TaxID=683228 RepID=UPI001112FD45|nr:hypothetical protein [Micromonospora yangpuensis]
MREAWLLAEGMGDYSAEELTRYFGDYRGEEYDPGELDGLLEESRDLHPEGAGEGYPEGGDQRSDPLSVSGRLAAPTACVDIPEKVAGSRRVRADLVWAELLRSHAKGDLDRTKKKVVVQHLSEIKADRARLGRAQLKFFDDHPNYADKYLKVGSKNHSLLQDFRKGDSTAPVPVPMPVPHTGRSRTDSEWADLLLQRAAGAQVDARTKKTVTTHLADIKRDKIRLGPEQLAFFAAHPDSAEKYLVPGSVNHADLETFRKTGLATRAPREIRHRADAEWAGLLEAHATDQVMTPSDLKAADTYLSDIKRGKIVLKRQVAEVFIDHPHYANAYLPSDHRKREPYEELKKARETVAAEGTVAVYQVARATVPGAVAGVPPLRLPSLSGPPLLRGDTAGRRPGRR